MAPTANVYPSDNQEFIVNAYTGIGAETGSYLYADLQLCGAASVITVANSRNIALQVEIFSRY